MWQDVRFGIRHFQRTPALTLIAILTLALGAGANALMLTVIDSVLLRPLPYPESSRLVAISGVQADGSLGSMSLPNFQDMQKRNRSFAAISAYQEKSVSLRLLSGEAVHSGGLVASPNLFETLRERPLLGRTFRTAEDGMAGAPCRVVLSAAFWREHLTADKGVVGQRIALDGEPCTVMGVMPDEFEFPVPKVDFWVPLRPVPQMEERGADFLSVIGRMKPGINLRSAQAELQVIAQNLQRAYPAEDGGRQIGAQLYESSLTGNVRPALLALLGAVALLLLIACANIANLQLARALGRKREMAIRGALGASRMQVTRQLLIESFMLALAGTALGLALATGCLSLLKQLAADALPRVQEINVRPEVCAIMLAVAALAAMLFGLAPVWQAMRQDLEIALRESATATSSGRKQQLFRDVLVVAQLTLAIVLLAGSGLLLRTLYSLLHTDPGFVTQHVLTLQTAVSGIEPARLNLATQVYGPELERIKHLPGVTAAGFITFLPLSNGHASVAFNIAGRPASKPNEGPFASLNAASDAYFRALQIPLVRGRFFGEIDVLGKPKVVLINDALARRYFPGQDPVGRQISFDDPGTPPDPLTIVGVVRGTRQLGLAVPPDPELYLSFRQVPPATMWSEFLLKQIMTFVVRSGGDSATLETELRRVISEVDPGQTVFHVATMDEIVSTSVKGRRLGALLLIVFALLAVMVAAAGLYGVLSYTVTQRTRDIALRIVLGANRGSVVRMVVGRALVLYAAGLATGLAGAISCSTLLSTMMTGVRPWDPIALGGTSVLLVLVCLLAAWLPAQRAAALNAYQAIRSE